METSGRDSESGTVTLHALSAGHFTLPEYQFISPVVETARRTVPSLAFLIQHANKSGRITRIVFDLGLRRDTNRYAEPIRKYITTRRPMTTRPDVVEGLARGGLTPRDIDYVIYSHVHWDHIGEPRDFPDSIFIVGYGALDLRSGAGAKLRGGHPFFEHDLLPESRTIELSDPKEERGVSSAHQSSVQNFDTTRALTAFKHLPNTLDLFGDGSVLIVDAPGHLAGHINISVKVTDDRHVYLAGDAFHDRRLLTGEKDIGTWRDVEGHVCCIHADRQTAAETIDRIRKLELDGVEVIAAHDPEWENLNQCRFFGVTIETQP
ncbi:hypothetical protein AUEXF2481DRAFT_26523 [Aureobasidium subglaciale EXF-2481]|uniref:Metallo-beta-lactamase domain-containing protein n=1 Tax=Aureobasidium subglaciale (strain EXF-2481) TaxID=1043005 RepID=A0A074YVF0_AURSE|nr:uncharacterized protein AUEXF2481DRAFT_26523 [Aureobasidium subglaciale EXF-2481]KEQ98127.1 hypothetical protein AUEXF2481DRAFT_26523 [Aureobasidium subglaciale EXF-2481]